MALATSTPSTAPARALRDQDFREAVPVHVVWELTLACDLKCLHCGSRAGRRRSDELDTAECLAIVESLARLGTREITLIGGEAYLRRDWPTIVAAIRAHDMYCVMQTGARNLTQARVDAGVAAGINGFGISLDGLAPLHDRLRGVPGSFARATEAVGRAKAAGLAVSVNTQIGADTMADLPGLMDQLLELGVTHWQIQLTVAMGNAADNDALLLQPHSLIDLMPMLAGLYRRGLAEGLLLTMGNNIGYFGPYEHLWRGMGDERVHWSGCLAGHTGLAIEADGTVKGCPSLATSRYGSGNVRDMTVGDLWRSAEGLGFSRQRPTDHLWGFCGQCYYADICRGGCTWTSDSLFGRPGNNPYCHYRVLSLAASGLRERVVKVAEAEATAFSTGRFDLLLERASDGAQVERTDAPPFERAVAPYRTEGALPPELVPCGECRCYIFSDELKCPHCAVDVQVAARGFEAAQARRNAVVQQVEDRIRAAQHLFNS